MAGVYRRQQREAVSAVVWLPEALDDLERLIGFLTGANPPAAIKAAASISSGSKILEQQPDVGKPMGDGLRRELYIPFGNGCYVLRYRRSRDGTVVIIRAWHSKETRQ